ncbi:MAG TPA: hypothetical protein VI248_27410 [Kineosporiaceae bacterium]
MGALTGRAGSAPAGGRTAAARPRRTVAQTRELLLRAGVDLLRDRAGEAGDSVVAVALAHVRFTQVAERATVLVRAESGDPDTPAVTTGALYNLWPNQTDFQADLLFHVAELQSALVPDLAESTVRFRQASARSEPLDAVLAELVDQVHRHYREDAIFRIELGFLISACDRRVQQALAHRHEAFAAGADRAWQALLDAYGRRLRPPYRIRHLTNAVAACLIGAVVLWYADPACVADPADPAGRDAAPDPGGQPGRSLTARAVQALFDALTERTD